MTKNRFWKLYTSNVNIVRCLIFFFFLPPPLNRRFRESLRISKLILSLSALHESRNKYNNWTAPYEGRFSHFPMEDRSNRIAFSRSNFHAAFVRTFLPTPAHTPGAVQASLSNQENRVTAPNLYACSYTRIDREQTRYNKKKRSTFVSIDSIVEARNFVSETRTPSKFRGKGRGAETGGSQDGTKRFSSRGGLRRLGGASMGRVWCLTQMRDGLFAGHAVGKLWTTAVNRNQAESIITVGSLPRDSTNRQGKGI